MVADKNFYGITTKLQPDQVDIFTIAIESFVDAVSWSINNDTGMVEVVCISQNSLNKSNIESAISNSYGMLGLSVPKVQEFKFPIVDWVSENLNILEPVRAGNYYIYSSNSEKNIPFSNIALKIPAGAAFGTGNHGSTFGCLLALDGLNLKNLELALDLGCGSGILAIAIAKRWRCKVIACDTDHQAVRVTRENVISGGLICRIQVVKGTVWHYRVNKTGNFRLIVCNILARTLQNLSKPLSKCLAPGGVLLLSGLLISQEPQIIVRYRGHGLTLKRRIRKDGWSTLVMQKHYGQAKNLNRNNCKKFLRKLNKEK